MRVLILAGGTSNEREVSLRSGGAVKSALETMNYEVGVADPATQRFDINLVKEYDVVFYVLHGKGGEDGAMQTALDKTVIPYVGTGAQASKLCFNKRLLKKRLTGAGIPMPMGEIVNKESIYRSSLLKKAFVLKPYDGGSSIDTLIVRVVAKDNRDKINELFSRHSQMLIEELIDGIEITVPVLGEMALPVIEIIPPSSGEFDYENKYNGTSKELCPPQSVDPKLQEKAQILAVKIHKICECRDYSRADMIVKSSGDIIVLETNTLPGMTDQSLFPRSAKAAGKLMPTLCDELVKMALSRQTGTS